MELVACLGIQSASIAWTQEHPARRYIGNAANMLPQAPAIKSDADTVHKFGALGQKLPVVNTTFG